LQENKIVSQVNSDSVTGQYLMVLTQGSDYALYISKVGYLFQSLNFNYQAVSTFEPVVKDIELVPIRSGSVAVLKNIFFDFDKYELKEKSVTELQKVIRFLNQNSNIKIEISGHTDNMGNASYNQQLSEKRAQSVYKYLVSNGIASTRLSAKGLGQTQPIDTNETEEGRQNNRRIEFKIR
jgi:outer membrane protein OmpA-like peptidoglycan-associated protein